MSRRVAILGLGQRGARWAEAFHRSGWHVRGFDPEPGAGRVLDTLLDGRREQTISATVQYADIVLCCLPERIELMQMVLQRAQAEAPAGSVVAVASRVQDIEAVQGCALRPGNVVRVVEADDGAFSLDVSERNAPGVQRHARDVLAELAGILSLQDDVWSETYQRGAESA